MAVECNADEWPLVTLTASGVADESHSHDLLHAIQTHVHRGRCAVLLDTRHVTLAEYSTAQDNLRREARWLSEHQRIVTKNVSAFGLVFANAPVRFLFSGLLAIAPLRVPWRTTTDPEDARRFCLARLDAPMAGHTRT